MFYAHFVLSKRGPLAKIWLAAHWEKKLTKAQVYETNIDSTVDAILEPKVKLALRTSGHLLLGVVRIYSRKAKYLLADCNEAFVKIKMAFRPGAVDLPDDHREAATSAITLPENFDDFDTNFNDFEMDAMDVAPKFTVNQSRPEEITIKEDYNPIKFITDDGFGGLDDIEEMREASSIEDQLFQTPAPLGDASTLTTADTDKDITLTDQERMLENDGFGDEDGLDTDLLGGPGLFEDVPMAPPDISQIDSDPADLSAQTITDVPPTPDVPEVSSINAAASLTQQPTMSDTTLLSNDAEAFALEPLDNTSMVTGISGLASDKKSKRRRKLLVDDQKGIDSQSMKEQLFQTNDIVTTLDLAPPTRKLMQWKESGAVEKLFNLPARGMPNRALEKLFTRNLSVIIDDEEKKHTKRDSTPEVDRHQERPDESAGDIGLPSVADLPEFEDQSAFDTPALPEDNTTLPSAAPEETPRKRQKLDRSAKDSTLTAPDTPAAAESAEEIDSGDDMGPPTLADQESAIVAEESTGDEVEDKRLNRRTHALLTTLDKHFEKEDTVGLLTMLKKNQNRKQAAAMFYTCLVLKKHSMVDVEQSEPYADIMLSRGSNFARSG